MAISALPSKEADLINWGANFGTRLTATPLAFNISAPQAASLATLYSAFVAAYNAAINPTTRGPASVGTKNEAKRHYTDYASALARQIGNTVTVTDDQRRALGLTVRATPSVIPIPPMSPLVETSTPFGRTVKVRLWDPASDKKRGFPKGVRSCTVFSHVGPTPPAIISDWKFEGSSTRNAFDIIFDASVPSGATVWITAFFANARMQSGPASTPVSINLPGGNVVNRAA